MLGSSTEAGVCTVAEDIYGGGKIEALHVETISGGRSTSVHGGIYIARGIDLKLHK